MLRLLLCFLLLGFSSAQAWEEHRTIEQAVTVDSLGVMYSTITVPTTTTTITKSISLLNSTVAGSVGVMFKATSTGVVGISIQGQRSFQKAAIESGTDATYIGWNVPVTTNDTAWHIVTLDTIVAPYMRLSITGTGSNDASTTVQVKVLKQ